LLECADICLECTALDALTDVSEEEVHGIIVVNLEKGPCEHFLGGEKVVDVGAVMVLTSIASACFT
jgi:hypothetical protein